MTRRDTEWTRPALVYFVMLLAYAGLLIGTAVVWLT